MRIIKVSVYSEARHSSSRKPTRLWQALLFALLPSPLFSVRSLRWLLLSLSLSERPHPSGSQHTRAVSLPFNLDLFSGLLSKALTEFLRDLARSFRAGEVGGPRHGIFALGFVASSWQALPAAQAALSLPQAQFIKSDLCEQPVNDSQLSDQPPSKLHID